MLSMDAARALSGFYCTECENYIPFIDCQNAFKAIKEKTIRLSLSCSCGLSLNFLAIYDFNVHTYYDDFTQSLILRVSAVLHKKKLYISTQIAPSELYYKSFVFDENSEDIIKYHWSKMFYKIMEDTGIEDTGN